LSCPLKNGKPRIIRAGDKDYGKTSEYGVMFTSKADSLVQAVHDGVIVTVARSEDGKYDVLIQFRGYFFWLAGVISPRVKTNQRIKEGDTIGTYTSGEFLELLMYFHDEPVNPRKYLNCK
jgi:septal ring factor EnvC (AmiA/AmiB activator)